MDPRTVSVCLFRRAPDGFEVLEVDGHDGWRLPRAGEVDVRTTPLDGPVGGIAEVPAHFHPGGPHRWVPEAGLVGDVAAALHGGGAGCIAWRHGAAGVEVLVLHRAGRGDGDWAWTPPGGALLPGESHLDCARRELREEAGLDLEAVRVDHDHPFAVFAVQVPDGAEVRLSDEHDRYEWLPVDQAVARCQPERVRDTIRAAVRGIA